MKDNSNITKAGSITPALLIITGAFSIVIYGLLFLLTLQLDFSHRQVASESALNIAEAGINYYAWHLAHDPTDYQDGTGLPGPYIHTYPDPQGGNLGEYSLDITAPSGGSSIVTVRSTGYTDEFPSVKRTIRAQFGIPSLAEYAFLSNSSVWHGAGATVNGPIHSNNGIRMDGTNTSLVTSAKDEYQCGTETGCFPPTQKPGVWGSGGDQGLWQFPVPAKDFDSISFDYSTLKSVSQSSGLYLGTSNRQGYHLVFASDGTVAVYEVNNTNWLEGYSVPGQGLGQAGNGGCEKLYQEIQSETLIGTYNVANTPVIFAEDDLWIEGTVNGKVTVVSIRFPITSSNTIVWIPNDLQYAAYDGSNVLGIITQNDIYFTRDIPDDFNLDGVLAAQKGKIIRHGFFDWCGGTTGAVKQKLTINGSVISYYKSYWNFGEGPTSGFVEQEINYDPTVLLDPPPYFPTSGEFEILSWEEE